MKVSVITPSYNQGKFIKRTIQSVAIQSGVEIEHVIVDGASTDGTFDVLNQFGHSIRWISEKDNGQSNAINKGIRSTNGEIIGWLNSDDIYYPGTILRIVEYFERNPEIDVVYGMADHIDTEDKVFESYPTESWDFGRLKETCFICQPALFFRRRVVQQHGLLDETLNYCMDYEYWLRLSEKDVRFAYLEEKLAGSRLYAENKTLGSKVEVHAEINHMLKRKFDRVPDRWLFNYAHSLVDSSNLFRNQSFFRKFGIGFWAVMAALRWNLGLTKSMMKAVLLWWKH